MKICFLMYQGNMYSGGQGVYLYYLTRELSREHRFDVVHDNQTLSYGVWAAHATGFPLVATIHHPLSYDLRNAIQQARTAYERARRILWSPWMMQEVVARRVDRVIVVSETSRADVEAAFELAPDKVRVVHNGIDTETFRPLPGVERQPHKPLDVGNSEDRNKGARYFLEAVNLLKDELDFRVTFVDNEKHNLKLAPRLVNEFGLNSRVDFTGRVPTAELVRHYNEAKLLVTSSLHEGFGLPLAEAMACGTPTVATDIGAYREIVEHGESGWLVPPGDARALAAAIRMMWNDASLRQRLSESGRRRIVEKFNWRKAAEETLDVYEEVVARRARR